MSTPLYLFPQDREPPEDVDLLAAEYALGALDPGDAAATRLRAESDPALRHGIAVWQARLALLAEILPHETPPHQLWQRLAFDIGLQDPQTPPPPPPQTPPPQTPPPPPIQAAEPPIVTFVVTPAPSSPAAPSLFASLSEPAPKPAASLFAPFIEAPAEPEAPENSADPVETQETWHPAAPKPPWHERLLVWRAATAILLLLVLLLAGSALFSRSSGTREVAAIGPTGAPAPLFLAETTASGRLLLTPLATIAVPNGRDLELWMIPADHAVPPTPLGVLPATGASFDLRTIPPEGTQLLVTMEPRGGSPSGVITGQVLYAGALANH